MTFAVNVCVLLVIGVQLCVAQNFVEPVEESFGVEFYEFEGERIAIYMQKVTWEQANQLCPARNGSLVEFNTAGVAEFVARALAESAVGFGSLWIGGQLEQADPAADGEWKWPRTRNVIDSKLSSVKNFPMEVSPYWVDKPPLRRDGGKLCLGTDRRLHHLPLIVSLECEQKRPYICKLPPADSNGGGIEVKPPVEVGNKRYHMFHGTFTWAEALSRCLLIGMQLATLTTTEQFYVIGNRMRRARPIMENAWIGGSYTDGHWKWVSNSEPVNVDKAKGNDKEPFPWYRPDEIIMEGCLLADRHVCDHFVYVEAKCDRRRPYICEEDLRPENVTDPLILIYGSDLWISTYIETWIRAQNVCVTCLGGELVHLKTTPDGASKQLPYLFQGMAVTTRQEIRHVWVGGHLFNKDFKWTDGFGKEVTGATALTEKTFEGAHGLGENGLLIYCGIDLSVDTFLLNFKCLNMDRENQKNFFMYGLQCDLKQYFICQAPQGAKLNENCKTMALPGIAVSAVSGVAVAAPAPAPAPAPTPAPAAAPAAPEGVTEDNEKPQ